MKTQYAHQRAHALCKTFAAITLALTLAACSSSDDDAMSGNDNTDTGSNLTAVVASRAGFESGQVQQLSISGEEVTITGAYGATVSDIAVATDGSSVYQLGRFLADNVTKYSLDNTETPVYQRSVVGDEVSANPYDIVFVNDTKAYMVRYDSPAVWIINPSAENDEQFKIGELDLSAYDTNDTTPEPNGAVILGDKLYISMERLDRVNFGFTFQPVQTGYVAVFDIATDTEIDTGMGTDDGLLGIPVGVENSAHLQYSTADDMLYILGRGKYFGVDDSNGDRYTGGVVRIDPENFTTELVLDDGNETENTNFLFDMLVVSATKAYVLTYKTFGVTTLQELNLLTGELNADPIASLTDVDITVMALGPNNRVWVGINGDEPGFLLLDPADNSILRSLIPTTLTPSDIVFISQ